MRLDGEVYGREHAKAFSLDRAAMMADLIGFFLTPTHMLASMTCASVSGVASGCHRSGNVRATREPLRHSYDALRAAQAAARASVSQPRGTCPSRDHRDRARADAERGRGAVDPQRKNA